jgi:hypothetical protein
MKAGRVLMVVGLALAGCAGGGRAGEPGVETNGGARCVAPQHICSDNCGHFMHNNQWYYLANHVHGGECGHHKIKGVWTYAKPVSGSSCRHDAYCGHYKYHGSWYYVAAHTHGDRCGHLYRNGEWFLDD